MLTTSTRDEDIVRSYHGGACSYVSKPVSFEKLKEVIKQFALYWSLVAVIPPAPAGDRR
jgi:response regulator of citrate/malate metabolism